MRIEVDGENNSFIKYTIAIDKETGKQIPFCCMADEERWEYRVWDNENGQPVVKNGKCKEIKKHGPVEIVLCPHGVPVRIAKQFYIMEMQAQIKIDNVVRFVAASQRRRAIDI